ncbi:MAG: helix-hairpin-helix domain-containing protein [Caldimonas sp.]
MRHTLLGAMLLSIAAPPVLAAGPAPAAAPASAGMTSWPTLPAHASMPAARRHVPAAVAHYVDINSAERKELMTLPGIGAGEADRIIAHRPYLTKTQLVTKNVLPVGPFMSLKNLVVAMPTSKKKGKA